MRRFLLRAAAIATAVQGIAHAAMLLSSTSHHDAMQTAVISTMRVHTFVMGGRQVTYWGMYTGYGLCVALVCLLEAVLLFIATSLDRAIQRMRAPWRWRCWAGTSCTLW